MLPNVGQDLFSKFRDAGYRIKRYREQQVDSIGEIVRLAYLDVCRTIRGIEPKQRELFLQAGRSFVEELLSRTPDTQDAFDALHHDYCRRCEGIGRAGNAMIHYGQAQKLLNMSLKYLYNEFALHGRVPCQSIFPGNNIESFFHLPVDNQIRTYLIDRCGFTDPTPLPWSQWCNDQYWKFQRQVRSRIRNAYSPLELDYLIWNGSGPSLEQAIAAR